ncbi:MAG: PadR family transcriptional regulator [Nitrososphaerota archaeon]|nr:PadR family transcriptional regulator [Nitrososphaerota archaeon]
MIADCEVATDLVRCTVMMLLYNGPHHGYSIMAELQKRLGRAVSPAIIYPFLASLSDAGYVTSRQEREGRRLKILYTLTPEGRRFSERVFRRLSSIVSTAIYPNSSVCAHCGCRLVEPGHVEKVGRREMIFCCVHCATAYKQGGQ